jgi:WD40 repeat protein
VAVGSWSDKPGGSAVYEVATGRLVCRIGKANQKTTPACFSPDGRLLAVHNTLNLIDLFDAATGRHLHELNAHSFVADVAFTSDGKALVSAGGRAILPAGNDGAIRFWDPKSGREVRRFVANPAGVAQMVLSPDGRRLATVDLVTVSEKNGQMTFFTSNRVRLWDAASGKELFGLTVPTSAKVLGRPQGGQVAFSPDGKELWTAEGSSGLWVWDAATGKELRHFQTRGNAHALAFAPDGKRIAIAEGGYCLHVRDRLSGRDLVPTGGHEGPLWAVAATGDSQRIATAGAGGAVRLWDRAGRELRPLTGHTDTVRALTFTPDGAALFSSAYDNTLRLWEVATGRELRRWEGPSYLAWMVAASPDGKTAAVVGRDKGVRLLDVATGADRPPLPDADRELRGAAFTSDGRTLLAWGFDRRLHEWDMATGNHRARPCDGLGKQTGAVAFAPDGRLLAFGGQEPFLLLADVATGREVRRFEVPQEEIRGNGIWGLAFSRDGRTLAWSSPSANVVWLGEVATGRLRSVLRGHGGGVNALAFLPGGRSLVSGANDTTALVWDLGGRLKARPLSEAELEACWAALAGADAARDYEAVLALAGSPKKAVPFLKDRLRLVPVADPGRVNLLLTSLDGKRFTERERAARALERLGPAAEPALRRALAGKLPLEVRRRVEQVLQKLAGSEQLRGIRAVEALELAGTAGARRLLQALAGAAPGARLTDEARATLARLAERVNLPP